MADYTFKELDRIYKRAIKHGYDGTYGDFISDFGNVPEDFLELSKKKTKKKDTRVASLHSSKDNKFKGHTTYRT